MELCDPIDVWKPVSEILMENSSEDFWEIPQTPSKNILTAAIRPLVLWHLKESLDIAQSFLPPDVFLIIF